MPTHRSSALRFAAILGVAALMLSGGSPSRSAETDPIEPVLLWPDDHPANRGDDVDPSETPEWLARKVTKPALLPVLPEPSKSRGAAVIICPGGGYGGLAMMKEGVEPARWLADRGIAGFVLRYRCGGGENQQPAPLRDAQRAIQMIRSRAETWGIDPERVGVWGWSAGGHLASCLATMAELEEQDSADPLAGYSTRPAFAVLAYPVISMQPGVTHGGSRKNLLGDDPSDELTDKWSTDQRVTNQTPPTFLVHASDDKPVPVKNALLFYEALSRHGVAAEMHIFDHGGHGFGMFRGERPVDAWAEQLEPWLARVASVSRTR